ncbi:hypothetical protein ACIBQ1_41345 [Nonomuraea sp. NPDC050153]|uniref:hypothetical protein n=1 Tax=Nonomuraea sp. NPDC050153 TaxID=3364359 RepID=UPI0037882A72
MSGLVQRLITRSREPVTGIRPRPAALFEDHAPASRAQAEPPAFFDAPDHPAAARPPGLPVTRQQALRRPVAEETAVYEEPGIERERSPRAPGAADSVPPAEPPPVTRAGAPGHPAVAAVRTSPAERRAAAPPQVLASKPDLPLPAVAEAGRAVAGTPLLRVPAAPVLAAPARTPRGQAAQDAPAPPVVEISIGRLEVRAPQTPAAPQAKPPRKDHTSVLQAYLRRRSRGELA